GVARARRWRERAGRREPARTAPPPVRAARRMEPSTWGRDAGPEARRRRLASDPLGQDQRPAPFADRGRGAGAAGAHAALRADAGADPAAARDLLRVPWRRPPRSGERDRKSTRLNSSHV